MFGRGRFRALTGSSLQTQDDECERTYNLFPKNVLVDNSITQSSRISNPHHWSLRLQLPCSHLHRPIKHHKVDRSNGRPRSRQPPHISPERKTGTAHHAPSQLVIVRVLVMQLETMLLKVDISVRERAIAILGDPAQDVMTSVDCHLRGLRLGGQLVGEVYDNVGLGAGGAKGHARWAAGGQTGWGFGQAEVTCFEAAMWGQDVLESPSLITSGEM